MATDDGFADFLAGLVAPKTTTLTPGTRVKLTPEVLEKAAYEVEQGLIRDEYTLEEFEPLFGWWRMKEPLGESDEMLVFESEFEVIE